MERKRWAFVLPLCGALVVAGDALQVWATQLGLTYTTTLSAQSRTSSARTTHVAAEAETSTRVRIES